MIWSPDFGAWVHPRRSWRLSKTYRVVRRYASDPPFSWAIATAERANKWRLMSAYEEAIGLSAEGRGGGE